MSRIYYEGQKVSWGHYITPLLFQDLLELKIYIFPRIFKQVMQFWFNLDNNRDVI